MLWYVLPAESVRAETFRDARKLGIKSSTDYTPSTRHSPGPEPPPQRSSFRQPTAVHFLLSQPGYYDSEHDFDISLVEYKPNLVERGTV